MDKPSPSRTSHQLHAKVWLEQAQAELDKATKTQCPDSNRARKNQHGSAIYLVSGLILLQIITFGIVLTLALPGESQPNNPDVVAALDVSSAVEQAPVLSEPPPPPTPTPQTQDIFERHSPQSADTEAAPVIESAPAQTTGLKFRGVEITQGIQVFQEPESPACQPDLNHPNYIFCNNSIPMVAGRHTLVRAYLACNGACPTTEIVVRLRLIKDGQEQDVLTRHLSPETLGWVNTLPLPDLRVDLAKSVNFEFFPPPAWLSGQVMFELEAVPQPDVGQSTTVSITKDFAIRKPLRIAYLPIEYQGLRPPDPIDVDYWLLRMYPVPDVEYYRLPMPDLVWEGDVGKSEVLHKLLYTYWFYAQYHPTEGRADQLFGWLPQELYNGGASDPFWCPYCAGPHSSRVAFGGLRPEQDIGGPRILAHEIAHNLGAQHAWSPTNQEDASCFKAEGVDIRVDPDWPYAQTAYIQEVGLDLYSDPPIIYPSSYYDMMAYCAQPWISPHTYRKIFDSPFLQPNTSDLLSFTNFQPQVEATNNGTLLISGLVFPDGTVSRPEVIRLEGDSFANAATGFTPPLEFAPPVGDDYCLNVQGSDDTVLAEHCFDVGFVDLETGLSTEPSPFFFTLPAINVADVEKVAVTKNQEVVVIVTPSNNPPGVNVTFPNGGEELEGRETITWDAHDDDGDPLRYDLLYSPDSGQNWLPLAVQLTETSYTFYTSQILPGEDMLIRVIASDGFNTTSDESNSTFSIKPPAENSISLLGPTTVEPGQTFEVSVVANQVAEPGLFGVQFELDFDPNMVRIDAIWPHSALELVVDETIDNNQGRVSFAASRRGRVSDLTGQLTLATLTFTTTQSQGQLHLDLHNVAAGARGGIPMTISEVQGLTVHIAE